MLAQAKSKISALDEGDLRPDQVQLIAKRLGVTEQDVVDPPDGRTCSGTGMAVTGSRLRP